MNKKAALTQKSSTMFLRATILGLGLLVIALCMFALPAGIRSDNTGLYKNILIGMYITVIPFFIALLQTLKLLKYIDQNKAFSKASVAALKRIKHCAVAITIMYALALPYIYYVADKDDAPGVMVLGLVFVFAPLAIAVFAAVLQKLLHNAMIIKVENDLTV